MAGSKATQTEAKEEKTMPNIIINRRTAEIYERRGSRLYGAKIWSGADVQPDDSSSIQITHEMLKEAYPLFKRKLQELKESYLKR